jgi:hypothetical protein
VSVPFDRCLQQLKKFEEKLPRNSYKESLEACQRKKFLDK